MSVLIKGMEMPKSCEECRFDAGGYCTAKSINFLDWCEVNDRPRPSWCPLVEVPTPHGDLIGKNALTHEYYKKASYSHLCNCLNNAPTIIESEGE